MIQRRSDSIPISPVGFEEAPVEEKMDELRALICSESEDDVEEVRRVRVLKDPRKPTQKEVEAHNAIHLPFRDWCPHCVRGRAHNINHKKIAEKEYDIPHIVCDYCFLGDDDDTETLVVQVARDTDTKYLFAHAVPRQGVSHIHGAEQLCKDIALKTDGEPAMRTLQEEVKSRRRDRTVLENSPVGESQSNGVAERAVQSLGDHVRVLRLALANRVGVKFGAKHPVTSWLVAHAADLISKFQVGKDGKTSYERARGKPFTKELVEFGECVFYRAGKLDVRHKLEPRWQEGVFLGLCWRTGAAFVGTPEDVVMAHGLRRVPEDARWKADVLQRVSGVPWQLRQLRPGEQPELRVRYLTEEEKVTGVVGEEDEPKPRRMRLYPTDFEAHGYTD